MQESNLLGRWGEATAAQYLRRHGYTILACNYRCRFGEIDLIAQKRNYVVFCEVKTRKDDTFAQALEFVDYRKQQRLRATASFWLAQHPCELLSRFDVIEVYAPAGMQTKRPKLRQIEDAFE